MRLRALSHSAWPRKRRSFSSATCAVRAAFSWTRSLDATTSVGFSGTAGTGAASGGVASACFSFLSASLFMSLIGPLDSREGDVVVLGVPAAEMLHPVDNRLYEEIDALGAGG